MLNAVLGWPVPAMFLLIGSLIYVTQQQMPHESLGAAGRDAVFATYISAIVPAGFGIKGILVAGIFAAAMSSLDSALGAMSSSAVTDFYRPYFRRNASEREYLAAARVFAFFFGVVLAGVALLFQDSGDLLEEAFGFASLVFGGMLGVFVLGAVTRERGSDRSCFLGLITSVMVLTEIKTGAVAGMAGVPDHAIGVEIAWPWWVVIGAAWSFTVGAIARTPDNRVRRSVVVGSSAD